MNGLKKQLLNLAIGEFAAACVFIFVYSSLDTGKSSLIAFSYLIFIIMQGSTYWFYRYLLIEKRKKTGLKAKKRLRGLRMLNMVLITLNILLIPLIKSSTKDLYIAIGILLFGIVEFVNYYWYRLSYGKSGFNIRKLFSTRLQKSSIHKLVSK